MLKYETLDIAIDDLIEELQSDRLSLKTQDNIIRLLEKIKTAPDELQDSNFSTIFEHFYNVVE